MAGAVFADSLTSRRRRRRWQPPESTGRIEFLTKHNPHDLAPSQPRKHITAVEGFSGAPRGRPDLGPVKRPQPRSAAHDWLANACECDAGRSWLPSPSGQGSHVNAMPRFEHGSRRLHLPLSSTSGPWPGARAPSPSSARGVQGLVAVGFARSPARVVRVYHIRREEE